MTRARVQRALIVAPKILLPQWRSELKSKFRIESRYESGRQFLNALAGRAPVVITTYDTLRRYIDAVREHPIDLAIFDEAHKLKGLYGVANPTQRARRIREALGNNLFNYALFLTATPIQNSPWDLYSLIDCVAATGRHDNPFGSPNSFRRTFLVPQRGRFAPPSLASGARDRFREIVSRYTMRVNRGTSRLPFPTREVVLERTRATSVEQQMLTLLVDELDTLNRLEQISLAIAMMSSPAAFAHQLERMASSRPPFVSVARQARAIASANPIGAKGRALRTLVTALRTSAGPSFRCVVFTLRRETQQAIAAMLESEGVRVGLIRGGRARENQATIDAFHRSDPEVSVIVSTDAGAEGVNLQVANVVVNYDLPWNPMVVEQRIGRVQRLGSSFARVVVYNLVVADSIEERVVARLLHKLQTITDALGDIEGILEAASTTQDEYPLEDRIAAMVLEALRGQDTDEAARRIEEEIERARQLYEREREAVAQTLGSDLDAIHRAGPTPPDIEPVVPRMDIRTFVRAAHEADGATVTDDGKRRLTVRYPGQPPFVATFDPDDPELRRTGTYTRSAGANVQLYVEGSRPFEQLVGSWASRRAHLAHDLRTHPTMSAPTVARSWLSRYGTDVELAGLRVVDRQTRFAGTLTVKATASTRHDRIERLVEVPLGVPVPWHQDDHDGQVDNYGATLTPAELAVEVERHIEAAVLSSPDVVRFTEFYEHRRHEEAGKVSTAESRRLVEADFTPSFAGDLQGARGSVVAAVVAEVHFHVDGEGPYQTTLTIDGGAVVDEPETQRCAVTARLFPASALSTCDVTGQRALTHRLVMSDVSRRRGVPAHALTCGVSTATVLDDEVETSTVSGVTANRDFFGHCAVTGAPALRDELVHCEATGVPLLPSERVRSAVSGRLVRRDQIATSVVSGTSGHKDEFILCNHANEIILQSEAARSDVSGLLVRADLLIPSEKNPARQALRHETIRCALSERRILIDEAEQSQVSGRYADKDLIAHSDASARAALPAELVRCEVTGNALLPDETEVCAETGKRAQADLLAMNDLTGTRMLADVLSVCPETGRRARPSDFAPCGVTGYRVDPASLTTCTETQQHVLKRLTVECAECSQPLLRAEAARTDDGRPAHARHVARSCWTGAQRLVGELTACSVTGALIERNLVSPDGASIVLHELMRARSAGHAPDERAFNRVARALERRGRRPSLVWSRPSSQTPTLAIVAEERRLLGLRRTYYAGFFNVEAHEFVGTVGLVAPR